MKQQERRSSGAFRVMNEVHADTIDVCSEVPEPIETARSGVKVKLLAPVIRERTYIVQRDAAGIGDAIRPPRRGEPPA